LAHDQGHAGKTMDGDAMQSDDDFYKEQLEGDLLAGISDSDSLDSVRDSVEEEEVDLQRYGIRGLPTGKQDSDDEVRETKVTWGQQKSKFYNAEEGWSDDEEIRKDEEEEAVRLRKVQLEKLSEQDFLDDFARPQIESEEEELELVEEKDQSHLVADLKTMLEDVNVHMTTEIEPILEFCREVLRVKPKIAGKRQQRKGPRLTPAEQQAFEYLHLKRRLLVDYMTRLIFALLLHSKGSSLNHPCMQSLSEKRSQLRICSHVESDAFTIISGQDEKSMKVSETDIWHPFSWETLSPEKQKREESKLTVSLFQNSLSDGLERLAVWYRSFVETGEEERPAFLDFDQEEQFANLVDPDEQDESEMDIDSEGDVTDGTEASDLEDSMEEKTMDTLEEIFVPLTGKSKVKKQRTINELDDDVLADKLLSKVEGLEKKEKKQNSRFVVGRVAQTLNKPMVSKLIKHGLGDADVPYRTSEKEQQAQASQMGVGEAVRKRELEEMDNLRSLKAPQEDIDAHDDALDYYNKYANKNKEKKQDRVDEKELKALATLGDWDEEFDVNQKRGASKQILVNRGLAPRTKKVNRNPRVKKRVKYAKAVTKMESSVRKSYKPGMAGAYGGEATGIKTNVSKSVRFGRK
jgi:U3 small nucleolar RNA-associated protein 3